jgi:predicted nuclease with TOPRIM domain
MSSIRGLATLFTRVADLQDALEKDNAKLEEKNAKLEEKNAKLKEKYAKLEEKNSTAVAKLGSPAAASRLPTRCCTSPSYVDRAEGRA